MPALPSGRRKSILVHTASNKLLFEYLTQITPDNAQAEYYLPDVLPLMISAGHKVAGYVLPDQMSLGINDRSSCRRRKHYARAICRSLMLSGVTIIDPQNTYIELGCRVGQDTVIYPQTVIQGGTVIGEDCTIGPNCRLANSQIGSGVVVEHSVVVDSVIGDGVRIDPHSYLNNCKKVEG